MQGNALQWIIPLIAVAVWIITHLLKAGNDQQKQRRQQQPPQGGGTPRRPAGDIDRFLEEIQRRRKDVDKKPPPVESAPPAPVIRETPRPVKPPPIPRRVEPPVVVSQRRRPPEIPQRPRQVVPPVELVVLEEVKEVTTGIAEANVAPSARAAFKAPTVSAAMAPTPGAKKLGEMLRTKEGLQAAILMNELIGPPRCKRK
jgi:hypothetical protein